IRSLERSRARFVRASFVSALRAGTERLGSASVALVHRLATSMSAELETLIAAPAAPVDIGKRVRRRRVAFLFAIVLAIAATRSWRSPWSASALAAAPDSVEYAVGAQRIATLGTYDLELGGRFYPPRYPPWFSLLLAPLYWLDPHELGIGILAVLA